MSIIPDTGNWSAKRLRMKLEDGIQNRIGPVPNIEEMSIAELKELFRDTGAMNSPTHNPDRKEAGE